jgi:hypothetical protein
VRKLRAARPDLSLSTDFIVGFPGETEADFEATMKLIDDVGFDASFSFVYSPRPGTPAADWPTTRRRTSSSRLMRACRKHRGAGAGHQRSDGRHGAAHPGRGRGEEGRRRAGRPHDNNRIVNFAGSPRLVGRFVDVRITAALPHSLRGEIVTRRIESAKAKPGSRAVEPVDNQRLANLCGALDENLRQIETAYDVTIARRGERFTLRGHPAQSAQAAQMPCSTSTPRPTSICRSTPSSSAWSRSGATGRGGQVRAGLLTRKPELHGRTPRQVQYLRQIQEHDITFGIGPAGTGKTYLAVASAVDAFERDQVSASCSRAPPSRPASGSASCPATSRRRSTPTCARSTTRSTT